MKKAIVTGVGGQDGYYIAKLLAQNDYDVIGIVHNTDAVSSMKGVRKVSIDLNEYSSIKELIKDEVPDEIYNFAGQSSSIESWENTVETCILNYIAPVAILEAIRDYASGCKFFQASSAEIFGAHPFEIPQKEDTRKNPQTPYAVAKAAVGDVINIYRERYGVFAINAIFYNHESIRRKQSFLPSKIAKGVASIKRSELDCLEVGNVDSKRDWGFAPDYMLAAWKSMLLKKPDDYIFATGKLHTVKEMISAAFSSVAIPIVWSGNGLDTVARIEGTDRIVVRVNPAFYREYDRCDSVGDPSKLYNALGWTPKTTFEEMIKNMTEYFYNGIEGQK